MGKFICKCHNQGYGTKEKLEKHIYYMENREKTLNYQNKYNRVNKDKRKEYNQKHRKEINDYASEYNNLPGTKKRNKIYRERVKEKREPYFRKYYQEHKEDFSRRQKEFLKTPKGKLFKRMWKQNRDRSLEGHSLLTKKVVQQVYEENIKKYGTLTCELCLKPVRFGEDSLEHFIPISRASEFPEIDLNARENLGVAHGHLSKENCNGKKFTKTLKEYNINKGA